MKKRLLPALLALAMVLGMLPGTALAAGSISAEVEGHAIRVANPNDTYYKNYNKNDASGGPWESVELTASKDSTNTQGTTTVYDVTLKATNLVSHDSSSNKADPKNAYWLGIAFSKPTGTTVKYYQSAAAADAALNSIQWSPEMTEPDGVDTIDGKEYAALYFVPSDALIAQSTTQRAYIKVEADANTTIYRINFEGTTLKPKTINAAEATLDMSTVKVGGKLPEAELTSVSVEGVVDPVTSSIENVATASTTWTKKGETQAITGTFPAAGEYTYTITLDAAADYKLGGNIDYKLTTDTQLSGNVDIMTGDVTIEEPVITAVSVKLETAGLANDGVLPKATITGFTTDAETTDAAEIAKLDIVTTWTKEGGSAVVADGTATFSGDGKYTYNISVDVKADSGYKKASSIAYELTVDTDVFENSNMTGTLTIGAVEPEPPAEDMVISAVALELDVTNAKANAPLPQAKVTGITLDGEDVTDAAEIAKAATIEVTTAWSQESTPVNDKFGEQGEYTYSITVDAKPNDGYKLADDATYTLTVDSEEFTITKVEVGTAYVYVSKLTVAESNIKPVQGTMDAENKLTATVEKNDVTSEISVAKTESSALVIDAAPNSSASAPVSVTTTVKQEVITELLKTEGGANKAGLTVNVDNLGSVTLEPEALEIVKTKGGTSVTVDIDSTAAQSTELPETVEEANIKSSYEVTVKVDGTAINADEWGDNIATTGAIKVTVPVAEDLQPEGKTFDIYVDGVKLNTGVELSADRKTVTITMPHLSIIDEVDTTTLTPPPADTITIATPSNGTVTADSMTAAKGDTVQLTVTPSSTYVTSAVTVTYQDEGGNSKTINLFPDKTGKCSFTMPADAVTVAATFVTQTTLTITDTTPEVTGFASVQISGMDSSRAYVIRFAKSEKMDADSMMLVVSGETTYTVTCKKDQKMYILELADKAALQGVKGEDGKTHLNVLLSEEHTAAIV